MGNSARVSVFVHVFDYTSDDVLEIIICKNNGVLEMITYKNNNMQKTMIYWK